MAHDPPNDIFSRRTIELPGSIRQIGQPGI
jgi:hypothetical protein